MSGEKKATCGKLEEASENEVDSNGSDSSEEDNDVLLDLPNIVIDETSSPDEPGSPWFRLGTVNHRRTLLGKRMSRASVEREANDALYDYEQVHVRQAGALQTGSLREALRRWCRYHNRLPIAKWLPRYKPLQYLPHDVMAGVSVGLTVIPEALAFASIAQVPLQLGLYSTMVCCAVYVLLGTSKDVSVGPTAIISILTATFVADLSDVNERAQYAILLAFLSGCVQILMGVLNLGFLIRFISTPVIGGFMSAAALLIATTQLTHLLGIDVHHAHHGFIGKVRDVVENYDRIRLPDALLGITCLIVLNLIRWTHKRRKKRLRSAAESERSLRMSVVSRGRQRLLSVCFKYAMICSESLTIIISTVFVMLLQLCYGHTFGIHLTPAVPRSIPSPSIPSFSIGSLTAMETLNRLGASGILLLASVSLLEGVAVAKAFGARNRYRIDATQEFIAVGVGNVMSALFGGYAVGGSIERTAHNSQSGVKTPLGGIVTSLMTLLTLAFLTDEAHMIPSAALAAVIITVALPMFNWREPRALWRVRKLDLVPFSVTFFTCLTLGIMVAMATGVALSIAVLLLAEAHPEILVETHHMTRKIVVTPQRSLYFPSADYIHNLIQDSVDTLRADLSVLNANQPNGAQPSGQLRQRSIAGTTSDFLTTPADSTNISIILDTRLLLDADSSCVSELKVLIQWMEGERDCALYFRNLPGWLRKNLRFVGAKQIRRDGDAEALPAVESESAPTYDEEAVRESPPPPRQRRISRTIRMAAHKKSIFCAPDCDCEQCQPADLETLGDVLYP